MATFVLVHGAWHGGWCWQHLTPLMKKLGHEIYTPTLTGLGERAHLLSPSVNLSCHIQDIANVLFYENIENVILVGHSYGGMVITGVADKCPERLSHLVYLDAIVPQHGETTLDQISTSSDVRIAVASSGDSLPSPPPEEFGVTNSADVKWMNDRLTPQPTAVNFEPLLLTSEAATKIPRTYISCTLNQGPSIARAATRMQKELSWQYIELATGHNAMITMPQELSSLLHSLAPIQ